MVLCAEAGAMILPAMPAFYQMPKTLDDLADFMAGKILVGARLRARAVSGVAGLTLVVTPTRSGSTPVVDKTPSRIAGMFDAIAPRYDLLNHVLSAGLDRRWRDRAVDALASRSRGARARPVHRHRRPRDRDRHAEAQRQLRSSASTSPARCCALGLEKIRARRARRRIRLVRGDATRFRWRRLMRCGHDRVRYPQRGGARPRPWPSSPAC